MTEEKSWMLQHTATMSFTSLTQRGIFDINENLRHIISTNQHVQFMQGISSVRRKMCSTSEAHHVMEKGVLLTLTDIPIEN